MRKINGHQAATLLTGPYGDGGEKHPQMQHRCRGEERGEKKGREEKSREEKNGVNRRREERREEEDKNGGKRRREERRRMFGREEDRKGEKRRGDEKREERRGEGGGGEETPPGINIRVSAGGRELCRRVGVKHNRPGTGTLCVQIKGLSV